MKTFSLSKKNIPSLLWVVLIAAFSYRMFQIIWPYTSWERDLDFLMTKQFIIHLDHYRLSFYAHIFSSLIVLFSGAFLFSKTILIKWPGFHRWVGKTYVGLLLLVSAPSGLIMSFYANGNDMTKFSFLLLNLLWWHFTYQGFQTARRRQFQQHKIWMMRSYALTLSAISLRIYQMLLGYYCTIDPVTQYLLVSWGSWLGNLMIVEYLVYRSKNVKSFSKIVLIKD